MPVSPYKLWASFVIVFSLLGMLLNNIGIPKRGFFYLINRPAHFLGVGDTWNMFSRLDRSTWQITIWAIHEDNSESLLPIPSQSRGNFWQEIFFEGREGKLNPKLYSDSRIRKNYLHYLCRQYRDREPPIQAIRMDLTWQKIFSPYEARKQGTYFSKPEVKKGYLGKVKCQEVTAKK